jgi:hypothetical protein
MGVASTHTKDQDVGSKVPRGQNLTEIVKAALEVSNRVLTVYQVPALRVRSSR